MCEDAFPGSRTRWVEMDLLEDETAPPGVQYRVPFPVVFESDDDFVLVTGIDRRVDVGSGFFSEHPATTHQAVTEDDEVFSSIFIDERLDDLRVSVRSLGDVDIFRNII